MSNDDKQKSIDEELKKLTNKINEISIEIDTFRVWQNEQWEPFVKEIKEQYGVENSSDSLKDSVDQYFNDKFAFIAIKLIRSNYTIMSIYLRQLLIDIYKYNYYLARTNSKNNKSIDKNIDQYYDNDENFSNLNEKKQHQFNEDLLFKNSKYINFWAELIFKDFGKNYKKIKNEIEHLKNHLSISIHGNSVIFFNSKLGNNKDIDEIIKNKIDLINQNLMIYDKSTNNYKIINSNDSLEYKNFRDNRSSIFNKLLFSWIKSIKEDFYKEYYKLVKLDNLKG